MAVKHHVKRIGKTVARRAKDHFVPHAGNNHTPHALRHRALLRYGIIMVLIKTLAVAVPLALPSTSLYSRAVTPANIIELTNAARKNANLPPLSTSDVLSRAAFAKAEDMLRSQYFAHTSPAGLTPWVWLQRVGYRYLHAGENLAIHFTSAEGVSEGWLASPTHRANIINPKFTQIGVAAAIGNFENHESIVVVQFFGTPAASTVRASPTTPPPPDPAVTVRPSPQGLAITAEVRRPATAVAATLGSSVVALSQQPTTSTWSGTLAYDPKAVAQSGERLNLIVTSGEQPPEIIPAATVAPEAAAPELYVFNQEREKTLGLLGGRITLRDLDDATRRFYVFSAILLAAALLINILIKIKIQKPRIIAHAGAIIALALFLYLI